MKPQKRHSNSHATAKTPWQARLLLRIAMINATENTAKEAGLHAVALAVDASDSIQGVRSPTEVTHAGPLTVLSTVRPR